MEMSTPPTLLEYGLPLEADIHPLLPRDAMHSADYAVAGSRYYLTSKNSKMVQDRAIFTMADQQKVINGLPNGAIFSDLERPLTPISRSCHHLTLNVSETVRNTDRVTMSY